MAKRPNLESIKTLLSTNRNFTLTSTQYEQETGVSLPKENYYLKNKSAVAKLAEELGFRIEIQERAIAFEKKDEVKQ